jgi:hypothetical protein
MTAFLIASLTLEIAFSLAFCLVGYFGKKKSQEEFSFRSYFPFELFRQKLSLFQSFTWILLGLTFLSSISSVLYAILGYRNFSWGYSGYLIAIALIYFVFALSFIFLSIVNVYFPKQHLSIFFVAVASSLLKKGMLCFDFFSINKMESKLGLLIPAIVLAVLGLSDLFLILNPRLKDWDRMERVANKDGTVSFQRPKRFVLAYSEWALFFLNILTDLAAGVGFYFLHN